MPVGVGLLFFAVGGYRCWKRALAFERVMMSALTVNDITAWTTVTGHMSRATSAARVRTCDRPRARVRSRAWGGGGAIAAS